MNENCEGIEFGTLQKSTIRGKLAVFEAFDTYWDLVGASTAPDWKLSSGKLRKSGDSKHDVLRLRSDTNVFDSYLPLVDNERMAGLIAARTKLTHAVVSAVVAGDLTESMAGVVHDFLGVGLEKDIKHELNRPFTEAVLDQHRQDQIARLALHQQIVGF